MLIHLEDTDVEWLKPVSGVRRHRKEDNIECFATAVEVVSQVATVVIH